MARADQPRADLARAATAVLGPGDGVGYVRAPGRVNLMGDHTDYNAGLVLPAAIDREVLVAFRRTTGAFVCVRSLDFEGAVIVRADGTPDPERDVPPWGGAVAALVRAMSLRGRAPVGTDLVISSGIPVGAGLSSSAAVLVGVATALGASAGDPLSVRATALACQEAETVGSGVPCGVMDPWASADGTAGHALLLDCRSLDVERIPMPAQIAVVAVHSGISRTLATEGYATRRDECEELARDLGLDTLREATAEEVADHPRGRHVVSENARVQAVARALRTGDRLALSSAFAASHASLRDDFEVSTPELDLLVRCLLDAGAIGARLTGAGFGGSVVALADDDRAYRMVDRACARYRSETGREPTAFRCRIVDGAGVFDPFAAA